MRLRPVLAAVVLTAAAVPAAVLTAPNATAAASPPYRVLFDDTSGEEAGNADWIVSTAKPDPTAQNANPTGETSWIGAISAWGVAC